MVWDSEKKPNLVFEEREIHYTRHLGVTGERGMKMIAAVPLGFQLIGCRR